MSAVRGTAPRIGCIAVAVPLLILAGWAAFEGWHQPDQDDRNEYYAVVLFARGALKAALWRADRSRASFDGGCARDWRISSGELADRRSVLILQRQTGKFA